MSKTLRQVAEEAMGVYEAHDNAAGYDAGFDGGEFSNHIHANMADAEVGTLAKSHGYTMDEVMNKVNELCNEENPSPITGVNRNDRYYGDESR